MGKVAPPSRGPRNVAEFILQDMRKLYEEKLEIGEITNCWKHLQQCLFKKVRVPLEGDMWISESQVMVVSAEYVARQVSEVLKWREAWLKEAELPKDTVMDSPQKTAFLKASKQEYHSRADQVQLQRRDWWETGK